MLKPGEFALAKLRCCHYVMLHCTLIHVDVFLEIAVARSLLLKGSVEFIDGISLEIVKPGSEATDSSDCSSAVLISEIPSGTSQDKLLMFLENTRRSGGGAVSGIQYNMHGEAIVNFEDRHGLYLFLISF